jgi:hypothetical protein
LIVIFSRFAESFSYYLRRAYRLLKKACSWFFFRLVVLLVLMAIAHQLPGWIKGPAWLLAFLAGFWAFFGLVRESGPAVDFLVPRLEQGWRRLAEWSRRRERTWKAVILVCALAIAGVAICRAWPVWKFMATSSLREDEIVNIARYTSRGFVPSVSTYKLARDHIFYNVLSTALPGADSTVPLRARLISFLSVSCALVLLVGYAGSRGWILAGVACAGLVAVNSSTLEVVLEARGYGFIFLCATCGCIAFTEWVRTSSRAWLRVLAVSCVLGTYTLPFYIVYGGVLLLLAFSYRPSRETFLAGFLASAAIAMLYLPIVGDVFAVFRGYSGKYGPGAFRFDFTGGVLGTLQYFVPFELLEINALRFVLIVSVLVLYIAFGRFARSSDRVSCAGVAAAILGFLAFCLFCKTVPIRVTGFLAAPLAVLSLVVTGSALSARPLAPFRPFFAIGFSLLVLGGLWKTELEVPLIARQDWRDIAIFVERAFPDKTRLWIGGRYAGLLQWNLSSRRMPEQGPLDHDALSNGKLIAVEGFFKTSDERSRLQWQDLPDGVRYVTIPLLFNYQRVFFFPPAPRGIASMSVSDRGLAPFVVGRQPFDPFSLSRSAGHGDVLYPGNGVETNPAPGGGREESEARPQEISLPAVLTAELEPGAVAGTCNFLFSQSLDDKSVSAEVQDSQGVWRTAPNVFVLGEMASIALAVKDCKAVRVHLRQDPSALGLVRALGDAKRPPFGLIDGWVASGSSRR